MLNDVRVKHYEILDVIKLLMWLFFNDEMTVLNSIKFNLSRTRFEFENARPSKCV